MVKSMTGYGRAQAVNGCYDILVEIKSVNHRYFEFSARVPRAYGYLEDKLKKLVQTKASRGKIEVNVSVYTLGGFDAQVEINKSLAKGYITALRGIGDELLLNDDLSLTSISRFSDIFTVQKTIEDSEVIWDCVRPIAESALSDFVDMRETEGAKMAEDILSKLVIIDEIVEKIEKTAPQTVEAYRNRLYSKLSEVLADKNIDEQRILTEAAVFAEKIAVDEETVRLKSHSAQLKNMLENSSEPIGRKLDFIVQEMNREINTTGSKAQNLDIARMVVDVKSEIEKIREQVQNIE